jgi:hypothetical protein
LRRRRVWAAAFAATVATLLLAGRLGGAPPRDLGGSPLGFDHIFHEGKVRASGAPEPACRDCHAVDARGRLGRRPGHAACFGACHGAPPKRPGRARLTLTEARRVLCVRCHAPAALALLERGVPARLGPEVISVDPDYTVALSHRAHDATSAAQLGCETCHEVPGAERARPPRAHERCVPCHDGTGTPPAPPMSSCETCHRPTFGPAGGPALAPGDFPVTSKFSHRSHLGQAHLGRGARQSERCLPCHTAVAKSADDHLPTPSMATCQTCHDGARAFSALGTACRRCHQAPARPIRHAVGERRGFAHALHARAGDDAGADCIACHGPDGRATPDHAACATASCHAGDFAVREPVTCSVCHIGREPWRPLHIDPTPRAATEFGARFSHRDHRLRSEKACTDCHAATDASRTVVVGHDACATASCHGAAPAPSPPMVDCGACHVPDLVAGRRRQSESAPWSVRRRFRHDRHAHEPGASDHPVSCTECHTDVDGAASVAELGRPAKARCARCHDGAAAFKMTGHACHLCHGRSAGSIAQKGQRFQR